jgi:hypothetical protein
MSDYRRGLDSWLDSMATYKSISNYNAIANLHILRSTTAHVQPSQSAITCRFLATASDSGDSSASALTSLSAGSQLHRLSILLTNSLTTL